MPFEIIKPGTNYDFMGKWRICVAASLALILVGLVAIPLRGFRLGIDFAGGTEVQVRFTGEEPVDEGAVRAVVAGLGISNASVVRYGEVDARQFLIKFKGGREIETAEPDSGSAEATPPADLPPDAEAADEDASPREEEGAEEEAAEAPAPPVAQPVSGEVTARTDKIVALPLALEGEIGPLEVERVEFVGPKVGAELRDDGLRAMAYACVLILAYIAFRFSLRFAPGAVVALIHDVSITSSLWILMGLEFDLKVLAALLAIIGYSLNDTIIVYDRIRENMELRTRHDLFEVLNHSVNQTLSRTLLTSLTTLSAVLALLLIGGPVIRPFALAMAIGVVVGTYSSIFIAAPTLFWLESRFGDSTAPVKPQSRGSSSGVGKSTRKERKPARA